LHNDYILISANWKKWSREPGEAEADKEWAACRNERKYKCPLFNKTNNKKSNAEAVILQHSTFNIQYLIFLVLRHSDGGAAQLKIVVVNILARAYC
jgi:hypothetical protein